MNFLYNFFKEFYSIGYYKGIKIISKKKYILLVVFHVLDCLNYDHSWRFN